MHSNKPFRGIEAEGPYKGTDTIFVPAGFITSEELMRETLLKILNSKVEHVYLGAGDCRGPLSAVEVNFISYLVDCKLRVFIEFGNVQDLNSVPLMLRSAVECILCLEVTGPLPKVSHIKLLNSQKLDWYVINNSLTTFLDDNLYQTDRPL